MNNYKSIRELNEEYWSQFEETSYKDYIINENDKENYLVVFDQDTNKPTYMKRKDILK